APRTPGTPPGTSRPVYPGRPGSGGRGGAPWRGSRQRGSLPPATTVSHCWSRFLLSCAAGGTAKGRTIPLRELRNLTGETSLTVTWDLSSIVGGRVEIVIEPAASGSEARRRVGLGVQGCRGLAAGRADQGLLCSSRSPEVRGGRVVMAC